MKGRSPLHTKLNIALIIVENKSRMGEDKGVQSPQTLTPQ